MTAVDAIRWRFLLAAFILFGGAVYFGSREAFHEASPSVVVTTHPPGLGSYAIASNVTAGLASLGFAIGGAAALLSAAIIREKA